MKIYEFSDDYQDMPEIVDRLFTELVETLFWKDEIILVISSQVDAEFFAYLNELAIDWTRVYIHIFNGELDTSSYPEFIFIDHINEPDLMLLHRDDQPAINSLDSFAAVQMRAPYNLIIFR